MQVVAAGIEGFRTIPRHGYEIGSQALDRGPTGNFPDLLADRVAGVSLTHEQGNALQPSLRFNGFAASPLLGTSQGLSVFQDGVRVNEPFGDVVNWDLVPMNAIRSIDVIAITDPVFGLNSLGGAIVLRTQDGRSAPGGDATLQFGSFGKSSEQFRYGGQRRDWSYFVAAQNQHERGYVAFTASSNRSVFAKLTHDTARDHADISYTFAQSRLAGSQTLPLEWMSTPTAIYTVPDSIDNRLSLFNLGDVRVLTRHWQLAARAYLRTSDQNGFNSNVNGNYDGATPTPTDPVAYNVVDGLQQQNRGLNLALHEDYALAGRPDNASLGVSLSDQRIDYVQVQQAGAFDAQRYTIGVGPFDQAPVDLGVHNRYRGLYFSDRLDTTPKFDVTIGGRYQQAQIDMSDHLGGTLGGAHRYSRFNPSVGLDLHPTQKVSYYLRYAEGMRVPMPVELTCASPTAPCTLPNVLIADPGLRAVVARSAQTGAVWHAGGVRVHAEYTMTRLTDAIQFISLAHMTQGYFTNVPRELYRSASLDASGDGGRWSWAVSVNRTEATYQSSFEEPSPSNSSAGA
ncbi:MAG TPA: TonB-dependent receptor, partial [Steroidobacteraceae bacterium]|nr:TonB-dependent receptor [Steroidobacteraceae bacterium]